MANPLPSQVANMQPMGSMQGASPDMGDMGASILGALGVKPKHVASIKAKIKMKPGAKLGAKPKKPGAKHGA